MGYSKKKMDSFAYLMWQILKKIKVKQRYWHNECWSDWIYNDESFVCDKIRGARVLCVVFYKIKGRRRRRKREGGKEAFVRL